MYLSLFLSMWFKRNILTKEKSRKTLLHFSSEMQPKEGTYPPCCPAPTHSARGLRHQGKKGQENKDLRDKSGVTECSRTFLFLSPLPFGPYRPHLPCVLCPPYCDFLPKVRWPHLSSLLLTLKHSCLVSPSCRIIDKVHGFLCSSYTFCHHEEATGKSTM